MRAEREIMVVVDDFLDEDRDLYIASCALCGFPLTKYQIAVDFSGTAFVYVEHQTIPCSFCLCDECWIKAQEFTNGGPDEAYRRIYALSVITRQRELEIKERSIPSGNESTEE
jgi:hypothetical protein